MGANILIVDDDELVLAGWKSSLESAGYSVTTALSGKDAVNMVLKEKPDIAIIDLVMPGMGGVDVSREIKAINPEIETVLVSGHPEEIKQHQMDFIKTGGRDLYLRKPLMKQEIVDAVNSLVQDKK